MLDVSKVIKIAGKLALPIASGVMTVMSALEDQKQKETIKTLVSKVAELESKVK